MTNDPHDPQRQLDTVPRWDPALDAVLRRGDWMPAADDLPAMESRILSQAALPLAARRRTARTSMADTLAAWVRVAIPLAAAAALYLILSAWGGEPAGTLADVELRESDPAALLSAIESDGSAVLEHHLVSSDDDASATDGASR
jgi:hypothetical protein